VDRRRRSSATPHLFLPYVGNNSDTALGSNSHGQDHLEEMQRYSGWGDSLEDFEIQCMGYMKSTHKLPPNQAAYVATALRKAANEATELNDLNHQYSFYASILDRSLSRKEHNTIPDTLADDSMDLTDLADHEKDSMSSQQHSLKNHLLRQQEEINFLRCALKQLIEPLRQDSLQVHQSDNTLSNQNQNKDDGIPYKIEFLQRQDIADDISEPVSQLTLSEDLHNPKSNLQMVIQPIPLPLETNRTLCYPSTNKSILQMPNYLPCIPTLDTPKIPYTASEGYVETMQLVYSFRTESRQSTYTDMVKGQTQAGRARGLKFQFHFKKWGVTMKGRYNGSLENGLPHGPGVLRFENRDLYIGEFFNGALQGEGTLFSRRDSKLVTLRGKFHQNEYIGKQSSSDDAMSAGAA
jgi:hypothetical protein